MRRSCCLFGLLLKEVTEWQVRRSNTSLHANEAAPGVKGDAID
jgi:hypothetical protein